MSRANLVDRLELRLQRLFMSESHTSEVWDAGLSQDKAKELDALVQIAQAAQPTRAELRIPASTQVDSKRRMLDLAMQMRRAPNAPLWRRSLRFVGQNFPSAVFALGILALWVIAFGSTRALPGDNLYPVKLAAEQAEVSLAVSPATRMEREAALLNVRADEVEQMIRTHRAGPVTFRGYFEEDQNGQVWQVGGIPVVFSPSLQAQVEGWKTLLVDVRGTLGTDGRVNVNRLQPHLDVDKGTVTAVTPQGWQDGNHTYRITAVSQINKLPAVGDGYVAQVARQQDEDNDLVITANFLSQLPLPDAQDRLPTVSLSSTSTLDKAPVTKPLATQPALNQAAPPQDESVATQAGADHPTDAPQNAHQDNDAKPEATKKPHEPEHKTETP